MIEVYVNGNETPIMVRERIDTFSIHDIEPMIIHDILLIDRKKKELRYVSIDHEIDLVFDKDGIEVYILAMFDDEFVNNEFRIEPIGEANTGTYALLINETIDGGDVGECISKLKQLTSTFITEVKALGNSLLQPTIMKSARK